MNPDFYILGVKPGDEYDLRYVSKTLIAPTEGSGCPLAAVVYLFVHTVSPPITLSWDKDRFPSHCSDFRSEIISRDISPLLVSDWVNEATEYTCMSYSDGLVEDIHSRDTFFNINMEFETTKGDSVEVYGFMLDVRGGNGCETVVSTKNAQLERLTLLPNLVSHNLMIPPSLRHAELNEWKIFNMAGNSMLSGKNLTNTVDVSGLVSGVYFLSVKVHGIQFVGKFTKV